MFVYEVLHGDVYVFSVWAHASTWAKPCDAQSLIRTLY